VSTTDVIASVALILGALMSLLAGIAVLRFPDTMSRIHAATKPQVLGIMLLMLGVGLRLGSPAVIGMLVLIVVLQFVTAPVSAHLTVRVAYRHATDDRSGGQGADPRGATAGAGSSATSDSAAPDAGTPDAGARDAGTLDTGAGGIEDKPAADEGPVQMAQALADENPLGNPDVDPDEAR
jgi:multicomponent Na+:H+ antiporter subunit G